MRAWRAISLLSTWWIYYFSMYILQFHELMKYICPPDANSVHNEQVVDKLKTIHAVHQFVPYAKSRLAIWVIYRSITEYKSLCKVTMQLHIKSLYMCTSIDISIMYLVINIKINTNYYIIIVCLFRKFFFCRYL